MICKRKLRFIVMTYETTPPPSPATRHKRTSHDPQHLCFLFLYFSSLGSYEQNSRFTLGLFPPLRKTKNPNSPKNSQALIPRSSQEHARSSIVAHYSHHRRSMGVMTTTRKRPEECMNHFHPNSPIPIPIPSSSDSHKKKRPRLSSSTATATASIPTRPVSSTTTGYRISRYPEPKQPLGREVHAPCRPKKFDLVAGPEPPIFVARVTGQSPKEDNDEMGNLLARNYRNALPASGSLGKGKKKEEDVEVMELDSDDRGDEDVTEVGRSLVTEEFVEAKVVVDGGKSTSSVDSELTNNGLKVVNEVGKGSLALINERDLADVHVYKKLLADAGRRNPKIEWLDFQIDLHEKRRAGFDSLRPKKEEPVEEVSREPFVALTEEEEHEVASAFEANRRTVLVTHQDSNIEITGEKFQCLSRAAWLNDEVINLYLELLKEREKREPKKFLKCHFFNTFFYKKLISGRNDYDFKSVRRWTSQRKLGYSLIECDKIFVPIHKEIHWCLAVINKKDEKFQYLDSLNGCDNHVLKVLARYFVDEVKDKTGKDIDVSSWEKEFVEDLPMQENGYDCGVFMIKYADFYSRGLGLCFNQEHMPYFRRRTAKEILRLRAD